jgi:hypothetical protein
MKFTSKLTQAEWDDYRKLIRPNSYWAYLLCFGIFIWLAVRKAIIILQNPNPMVPTYLAFLWLPPVAIVGWTYYNRRKAWMKTLARRNARPEQFDLVETGISWEWPEGANGLIRWEDLKRCHDGKHVIVLERYNGQAVILPITTLAEIERQSVRQLLRSHIS